MRTERYTSHKVLNKNEGDRQSHAMDKEKTSNAGPLSTKFV